MQHQHCQPISSNFPDMYFVSPRLLGLPPAVREHVYRLLMVQEEPDSINDIRNLLQTDPLIYEELAPIVYAKRHFVDQYSDTKGLQRLRGLAPNAIRSLAKLTVLLNVCACQHRNRHKCAQNGQALSSTSPQYETIIAEWYCAIQHIAPFIRPEKLQLFLICDAADLDAARAVVQPLLDGSFPTLGECSIRISHHVDPAMKQIASQAVKHSIGYSAPGTESAFRLLELPWELRYRILQYTDLTTPFHEVYWVPNSGYHVVHTRDYQGKVDPEDHHGSLFRACWRRPQVRGLGCFCIRYHSVYTKHCQCWQPPTSLFLVCKLLLNEARDVFFSQNRFIITPIDGCGQAPTTVLPHFEASTFMQDIIPSQCLHLLRFLEIVFPPLDEQYLAPRGSALQNWEHTVEHLRDKLNLPSLTLRVYYADFYGPCHATPFRRQLHRKEGWRVGGAYMRIIRPLQKLKESGLKKLFVYAAWPWMWTRKGRNTARKSRWIVDTDVSYLERRLERRVMGDEYDSALLGKHELPKSQWLKDHEMYEEFACWCFSC